MSVFWFAVLSLVIFVIMAAIAMRMACKADKYRAAWLNQCKQTERDAGVRREMMAELEEVDKERRNAIDLSDARRKQIEGLHAAILEMKATRGKSSVETLLGNAGN